MQQTVDVSPLIKAAARLIDLHDSRRAYGESATFQTEERAGNGDGRYLAMAAAAVQALDIHCKHSGDDFATGLQVHRQVS